MGRWVRTAVLALIITAIAIAGIVHAYTYQIFQPTSPSVSSTNTQGYLAQLPQCNITSNPYGGGGYTGVTGTFGLFSCVAINYGAISVVVWFYEPNGGQGTILSFEEYQYPVSTNNPYAPWLYVGSDGILRTVDWAGSGYVISTSSAITPGWHMAVVEEWASSTSGPYYLALYLDGQFVGQATISSLPQLFGRFLMSYSDVGGGRSYGYPGVPSNIQWWFFNGTIAYVAIYNTVLSQSQVQQLYSVGFPNTLYSDNLVVAYFLNITYYQGLSSADYYFTPYFTNTTLLSNMGISNATAITITPSGSVGQVPSSQFSSPVTIYFYGVYPQGTNSLGYQLINVNAQVTYYGQHTTYTSVNNVDLLYSTTPIYVYVNGLPNGWAPDVWDSKVGAWSYEYNYTISSGGTYYLVVATELTQLASPPVPQLPYEAIVVEMTKGALVTSLSTLYLITNSTGVYTPLFGGSGNYVSGVLVASPYYYATSSGSASGPPVGTQNALPYGIAYWVVAADTNSTPFILGFNGAFSEDLMFPGLVNGVYFYAPSPTGYGNAYLPANTTKLVNAPVTFQVSFYVSSSSASGVLLAEENNYYPNTPTYYVPIIWLNNGVVYAYLGGSCGTATQVTTVSAGNTYTITLYWDPANNTGEAYINGAEVAKSTSPVSCNAGQSMPYVVVGDGYTNGWANTNNGWFPLSGVQIYYVAIWYNQLSTTTPSGNPTFLYEPSLPPNTNNAVFGSSVSAFSLIPGQPVYLGTYNGINGYQMNPFKFEYPEASSSTSTTAAANPILVTTRLQPSVNPLPSIQFTWLGASGPAGGFYYSFSSSGFDYVGGLNGFFKDGQVATIGFQKNPSGYSIPGIVTDSFNVTAVDLYANSASLPSNSFAYYIPEIEFIQPGQTYYLYIPQSSVGYIGLNYMTSNIVSMPFSRACQPTNTIPSLGTTTFQWYWQNGMAWTQQSGSGSGTWWWGFVNNGPNQGFLIINGSNILFATLLSRLNVSSIAAWSGGSSVTVDLSVTQSGQPIWLTPIYLVFAYSGQYVYGLYANAIEVEPNYVSYSITLPTCLANNPVTVTAYSVPTQEITSLLLTLTNPLNIILGATTVTPYPVPTNVTIGTTGTPPTTTNKTSSGVPVIQIGATQQSVVLPWWGTTLQPFIQINLATPIGIIGVGLIFGLLAYYWRTNRSGLLALAGGGIALFIIGAALSSIPLIALGLFIAMVSIAAFYVKRS